MRDEKEKEKEKEEGSYGLIIPRMMIELEARDREGNMIKKSRGPANSWLNNFYEILEMLLAPHLTSGYLADYGASGSLEYKAHNYVRTWDVGMGGKTEIGVGNSDTAYGKLQTKLQGAIVFWADMEEYAETSSKVTFKASILCTSALTVKEVGLRFDYLLPTTGSAYYEVMIERTVLDAADQVDVPAGGSIIATYELALPS